MWVDKSSDIDITFCLFLFPIEREQHMMLDTFSDEEQVEDEVYTATVVSLIVITQNVSRSSSQ